MARILIVDDESTLLATLSFNLERQGYDVITAFEGGDALRLVDEKQPDLVLLDLMLPGMHGFEICRALRKRSSIPIIILTARTDEVDRVVGLELGADDYITKPFSMNELIARVRACLRRSETVAGPASEVITAGSVTLDLRRRQALVNGEPLDLKPKEFDLLLVFMQNRGRTLTRGQLLRSVWQYEDHGSTRTVDVHVGRLRRRIEANLDFPELIVTMRGTGYRFAG
jgi:DNA-binding response OmpR family regulator